jgi:hypothetical protein
MESSQNQIIINTRDASGIIRNINYFPNRNISIINSNSSPGANVNFTDAVTLNMTGRVANLSTFFSFVSMDVNYGIINFTLPSNITPTSGYISYFSIGNSLLSANQKFTARCIGCSAALNPLFINIICNHATTTIDFRIVPHGATLTTGTIVKIFFIVN